MVASSRGPQGDSFAVVVLGLVVPVFGVVLVVALCALKRFNKDKEAKISKGAEAVSLTPVTSFNGVDSNTPSSTPTSINNAVPLRSNDLFSTKASLPKLQIPNSISIYLFFLLVPFYLHLHYLLPSPTTTRLF
jgi:hypothetical protein